MINIDAHKLVGCITMFVWVFFWLAASSVMIVSEESDLVRSLYAWAGLLGGIGSWYLIARFLFKKDSPQNDRSEIDE